MSESKREYVLKKKHAELERKRQQGLRATTMFYTEDDYKLIDKVKVEIGAKSRSEAVRWILKEFSADLSAMVSAGVSTEQKASHG